MQTEIEQVCAEFATWVAAQTDEGIKSRCQIILRNLQKLSADPEMKRCANRRCETWLT